MTKMILTLVALATLGTAALAPTDASAARRPAFHRAAVHHNAGRPAHARRVNIRIRIGARPAWHRRVVHTGVRFGYRPFARRPGFVRRIGYAAPVAAAVTYAAARRVLGEVHLAAKDGTKRPLFPIVNASAR